MDNTKRTIIIVDIIFFVFLLLKFIFFTSFLIFLKGCDLPMPIPILSAIILIFVIWIQYEVRRTARLSKKRMDSFWQYENNSNVTRRVDISTLDYITISLDCLPMSDHEDQTINSYRDIILKLSDKKILNLTGVTNTELKYQYGAANINLLSEYDNNYTILVSFLHKWAEQLYTHGYEDETVAVLEFAVSCYTDVSKSYHLLASIYKKQNTPEKITGLIELLPKTKMLQKEKLIDELTKIQIS